MRLLTQFQESLPLSQLGTESNFRQRNRGKITPPLFLKAILLMANQTSASLSQLAIQIGLLAKCTVSKQSVWERLRSPAVEFLKLALASALGLQVKERTRLDLKVFKNFGRVLIQDSTHCKLPDKLEKHFPGASTNQGERRATLKIQAIFNLLSQRFISFSLSGFTRNDQAASSDVLEVLQPGDLVIRDLGYYVVGCLEKIHRAGACFLSRLRVDTQLFNLSGQKPLNLLKLLQGRSLVDESVLLGQKQKLRVRLVAVALPPAVATERRRKARANRDRRLNPSPEHLKLLGWAIFITNVPQEVWNARTVARAYRVRWQIEIIFKAWKSHLNLESLPREPSAEELQVLIYGRLILGAVLANAFGACCLIEGKESAQHSISLLKMAQIVAAHQLLLTLHISRQLFEKLFAMQLAYHARYEKRKRTNMIQNLFALT